MKPISLIQSVLFIVLLYSMQIAHANTGKAINIQGTATINDQPLTLETVIKSGDVIKTAEGSSVKIIMKDKTVLDLNENTSFKFDKYTYNEDAPEESKSSFSLFKGTFRYISGLIAKKDPKKVKFSAGTATIGIRGTLTTIGFDGNNVNANSSIGTTSISFSDGTSITVSAGNTGSFNFSTGQSSVAPSTTPDTIGAAALAIANNPDAAAEQIAGMTDAEATLVMAAIMNNASQLNVDSAKLTSIVSKTVAAKPSMAVGLSYVAGALSNSSATTTALTTAITENAAAEDKAAIEAASKQGEKLEVAPSTTASGETVFNLREALPGEEDTNAEDTTTDTNAPPTGSGSPLSTEEFITVTEEANS